jgi:hypothetical protein
MKPTNPAANMNNTGHCAREAASLDSRLGQLNCSTIKPAISDAAATPAPVHTEMTSRSTNGKSTMTTTISPG